MDSVLKTSNRKRRALILALVALGPITVSSLGCSTFGKKPGSPPSLIDKIPLIGKKKSDEAPEPYPNPVKMAATWTPDTLVQSGRTPTRGFGGRVFFYDEKSRAVPVEGTLVIHGFDDSLGTDNPETKRFEFTPEQFTRHYGQSELGASYSIWIPWDAIGNPQRRVSLVTSFKTVEGKLIQGIPATVQLPGARADETSEEKLSKLSPEYREYRAATEAGVQSSGLTTTTIARRMVSPSRPSEPAINMPPTETPTTVVATGNATPSLDIGMRKQPAATTRATVLPASATMPVSR